MRTHLFRRIAVVVGILGMICMAGVSYGQTAQTGALSGTASDPSGNVLPGVSVSVTNTATGQVRTTATQGDGRYMVPLLPPGSYKVEATRSGFKTATIEQVRVSITETATLNFKMQVGAINEVISVEAEPMQLDIESSTLGHITDERMVEGLPLVSRNYTQILGLSPGVSGDVTNSAHIGRGDSSLSSGPGGYSIGGNSTNDKFPDERRRSERSDGRKRYHGRSARSQS